MHVKTDTKEKFHVITIEEKHLSANMTAAMEDLLGPILQNSVKNVVLNCTDIETMDDAAAAAIVKLQQAYYEQNASFVVCCVQPGAEKLLRKNGYFDQLNPVPTESEAWDIIQMEEIERDLFRDDAL